MNHYTMNYRPTTKLLQNLPKVRLCLKDLPLRIDCEGSSELIADFSNSLPVTIVNSYLLSTWKNQLSVCIYYTPKQQIIPREEVSYGTIITSDQSRDNLDA